MKKSENLVATLLAVYAIILTLCIAIYAIFKLLDVDITLATNLLIWSATIFAPIAVLMTYTSWKEQKTAEVISNLAQNDLKKYAKIMNEISQLEWSFRNLISNKDFNNDKRVFDKSRDRLSKIRFPSKEDDLSICFYLSQDELRLRQNLEAEISHYINLLIVETQQNLVAKSVDLDSDRILKQEKQVMSQYSAYRALLMDYADFNT